MLKKRRHGTWTHFYRGVHGSHSDIVVIPFITKNAFNADFVVNDGTRKDERSVDVAAAGKI